MSAKIKRLSAHDLGKETCHADVVLVAGDIHDRNARTWRSNRAEFDEAVARQ
jgi:hypothetical protein